MPFYNDMSYCKLIKRFLLLDFHSEFQFSVYSIYYDSILYVHFQHISKNGIKRLKLHAPAPCTCILKRELGPLGRPSAAPLRFTRVQSEVIKNVKECHSLRFIHFRYFTTKG